MAKVTVKFFETGYENSQAHIQNVVVVVCFFARYITAFCLFSTPYKTTMSREREIYIYRDSSGNALGILSGTFTGSPLSTLAALILMK